MKIKFIISIMMILPFLFFAGCKTSKSGSSIVKIDQNAKSTTIGVNLKAPINTADEAEFAKQVYSNKTYLIIQNKKNQFKENSPFIQILDGGKRERLWFASSRADDAGYGRKTTNNYQQIYFSEREVGGGMCPTEGWGEPVLFKVDNENPNIIKNINSLDKAFQDLQTLRDQEYKAHIDSFNVSTKGAITMAVNTIILSCDQMDAGVRKEFKQLYSVNIEGDKFNNPKELTTLSTGNTWESQPTLSANAKHLFFVSNRKVNNEDLTFDSNVLGHDLNIYYSFNSNGEWATPVLVKELFSSYNEITPQISQKGDMLYLSCNKSGNYEIYQIPLKLNDENGGYILKKEELRLFDRSLIDICSDKKEDIYMNGEYNQTYPFPYFNPLNKKVPQAFFWSSDNPGGMGSFDIYGCAMPFKVNLQVVLIDACKQGGNENIELPVIELTGAKNQIIASNKANFELYAGLDYQLKGGSNASESNGIYKCDIDDQYVFVGYSKIFNVNDPGNKEFHTRVISGAEVPSKITQRMGKLPLFELLSDTIFRDTILITKAWQRKLPCPIIQTIKPTYLSIAYFQTGFWEVNTPENLKRDMERLHEGFEFSTGDNIFNPKGRIIRKRSDYGGTVSPSFPIKLNDRLPYSIANASWIELHPNNQYWGDRADVNDITTRMNGRKERIDMYLDYAKKVEVNLKNLTDSIKNNYIHLLDKHKTKKPKLLIEIFAVSDQREVSGIWYIGDTVNYRAAKFDPIRGFIEREMVKVIPPKVDEQSKKIVEITPFSLTLNNAGNNGSYLGKLSGNKLENNANLSRLRAWFGYKEVYKHLMDSDNFKKYLSENKIALPDNNVSYDDADIIIITQGRGVDEEVDSQATVESNSNNSKYNYKYYQYDGVRRIEVQARLLFGNKVVNEIVPETENDYCCDPTEALKHKSGN